MTTSREIRLKSRPVGVPKVTDFDLATVELAAQSTDASVAFSGERAIFIGVKSTPLGNPLNIVKGVRELFPELERNLPPSLKMKVAYDSTKFITSSIEEVRNTLIEAVVIVVVVIFLFLASLRSVIIPVVTIPLSLIGVCSLMLMAGFSFNLLTLLAMVLAIGLVVDDAIVVVENIHRHLEEGKSPVQASLEGAREIIDDNQTGRLVPIEDVKALAKAIGELLSDPKERDRLSGNARRAVRERFSLERMLEATEQVYRQVVGDPLCQKPDRQGGPAY